MKTTEVPSLKIVDDKLEINGKFEFDITPAVLKDNLVVRTISFDFCVDIPYQILKQFNEEYLIEVFGEKLKQDFISTIKIKDDDNISISWVYKRMGSDSKHYQSLVKMINNIVDSKNTIYPSYVLKDLIETLDWSEYGKPNIVYRYDSHHSIINRAGEKIKIYNYVFNHQKDEEWIGSIKNVNNNLEECFKDNDFLNIKPMSNIWENKKNIRKHLNYKFTSGQVILDNDVIYTGFLEKDDNIYELIHFHIDELKSEKNTYVYSDKNTNNPGLIPYLKYAM
jgi:hypothetical protein